MRYMLSLCILSLSILFGGAVLPAAAQTGQTIPPPPPLQLPPIASTSTACLVNCDTAAMNCLNSCIVPGPSTSSGGGVPATASGACNNACSTTQLVCKQGCTR